jgi:RIO kinase 1
MLIREVVKMLCAGIIHGDLSEYNILFDQDGPVIIDFPQAVAAAQNNNAAMMLKRDVENLKTYFGQFDERILVTNYADEIWGLYEKGQLEPDSPLTGYFAQDKRKADVRGIIEEISAVKLEHEARERQKAERD